MAKKAPKKDEKKKGTGAAPAPNLEARSRQKAVKAARARKARKAAGTRKTAARKTPARVTTAKKESDGGDDK